MNGLDLSMNGGMLNGVNGNGDVSSTGEIVKDIGYGVRSFRSQPLEISSPSNIGRELTEDEKNLLFTSARTNPQFLENDLTDEFIEDTLAQLRVTLEERVRLRGDLSVNDVNSIIQNMRNYLNALQNRNERLTDKQIQELIRNPVTDPRIKEQQRLEALAEEANLDREIKFEESQLINLSLREIGLKIAESFLGLIDDLTSKPPEGQPIMGHIINSFTKNNRLTYFGIVLVVIAIFINLVRLNEK